MIVVAIAMDHNPRVPKVKILKLNDHALALSLM